MKLNKEFVKGFKNHTEFMKGYEEFKKKLAKVVEGPLEDFIREYELYREGIQHVVYDGTLYKVGIELNEEGIKAGLMEELCNHPGLLRAYDNTVILLWNVPLFDGSVDLELDMYDLLEDYKYGEYWVEDCVYSNYELFIEDDSL